MSAGLFVTGTDTGVGKTAVSAGLLAILRRRGIAVAALKPAETGWPATPGAAPWPPDGGCLARAAGLDLPLAQVVPYTFAEPLAPAVAAARAGVRLDPAVLDSAHAYLQQRYPFVLVEGAGGLAVPLTGELTMAGLAARWRLPVLLVARAGLGTINHTVLSVAYARQQGLTVLGIVINSYPATPGAAEETSPGVIAAMTGVPVLGRIPHLPGVDVESGRVADMAVAVEQCLDLNPIFDLLKGDA